MMMFMVRRNPSLGSRGFGSKQTTLSLIRDANGVPRMLKKDVDRRSIESGGLRMTGSMMMVGNAIEMAVQYPHESENRKLSAHVASYINDYNEYQRCKFLRVDRITLFSEPSILRS